MNEVVLQKEIDRLRNELTALSDYHKKRLFDMRGEVDRLKLEMAALRIFLEEAFPDFTERFPRLYRKTMEEMNPELDD